MSERAKGKWEVGLGDNNKSVFAQSPYQSKVAANGSLVAICYGKNAKDNAQHIIRCQNAFEPDGSHSKLLDALSKIRQIAGTIQGKGTLQAAEIWKIIDETQAKEKK